MRSEGRPEETGHGSKFGSELAGRQWAARLAEARPGRARFAWDCWNNFNANDANTA